jgi:hypothetical protein
MSGAVGSVRLVRVRDLKKAHVVFGTLLRLRALWFMLKTAVRVVVAFIISRLGY